MTAKHIRLRYTILALFVLYGLVLLFILVIPNNYRGHNVLVGGLTGERWIEHIGRNFNLVPFRGITEQVNNIIDGQHTARNLIYLVGNIVGFFPLGFFLPVLFARQRKFSTFIITVLLSLVVLELVQVVTMRGSFDIDDIILNGAGACLGFAVMRKCVRRIVA